MQMQLIALVVISQPVFIIIHAGKQTPAENFSLIAIVLFSGYFLILNRANCVCCMSLGLIYASQLNVGSAGSGVVWRCKHARNVVVAILLTKLCFMALGASGNFRNLLVLCAAWFFYSSFFFGCLIVAGNLSPSDLRFATSLRSYLPTNCF